jgi:hypothetical protein
VEDCSLFGYLKFDHLTCVHHDLCRSLLSDSDQTLTVDLQQLITSLKPTVVPSCSSFYDSFDVDSQSVFPDSLGGHNT